MKRVNAAVRFIPHGPSAVSEAHVAWVVAPAGSGDSSPTNSRMGANSKPARRTAGRVRAMVVTSSGGDALEGRYPIGAGSPQEG